MKSCLEESLKVKFGSKNILKPIQCLEKYLNFRLFVLCDLAVLKAIKLV